MKRAEPLPGAIAPLEDPAGSTGRTVKTRSGETIALAERPARAINTVEPRRPASGVRLTLASCLGNTIDGAWWPHTGQISRELTELVSVLDVRLGQIIDINVNWSSLQSQPDATLDWWQRTPPHIMTVRGRDARANLLIVPHRTRMALAVMVLRRAAGLNVNAEHRGSPAFETADSIVRAARGEQMFAAPRSRRAESTATPRGMNG